MAELKDVVAERAVLATVWQHGDRGYTEVNDLLTFNTFTIPSNQALFRCFTKVFEEDTTATMDFALLMSTADSLGLGGILNKESEQKHIRAITNMPVDIGNARKMAAKIRKLEIARVGRVALRQAEEGLTEVTGDESIAHIMSLVENPVYQFSEQLSDGAGDGPELMGDGLAAYVEYLKNNQRDQVGISTGFKWFDKSIGGGLRPKTVNVIGARPKTGKTVLADNMSFNIAEQGIPVLNLDTEMSKEDHWNRMVARLSNVKIEEIETGQFARNVPKTKRVTQAVQRLEKVPYHYRSIAGQPFEDTLSVMRRWVTKTVGLDDNGKANPCVIVFDYLKLMSADSMDKSMAEFQILGFMMTGLHNFMVKWGVPCVAFVQLNRDGINKEDTDVVSQSDRIIWLCSNFSIFKAKGEEEQAEENLDEGQKETFNRKMVPLIARHGAGLPDGDYINMRFKGDYALIEEGPTRKEMYKGQNKRTQDSGMVVDEPEEKDNLI